MMTDVMLRERLSELLPEGVAIGPDGKPTRDPTLARRGALLPFGGYKGFGLALMIQADYSPGPARSRRATTATCSSPFGPTCSG